MKIYELRELANTDKEQYEKLKDQFKCNEHLYEEYKMKFISNLEKSSKEWLKSKGKRLRKKPDMSKVVVVVKKRHHIQSQD